MGQLANDGLRPSDFFLSRRGVALLPEWDGMRVGMVPDPMAFAVSACGQSAALRLDQLFADDEERSLDATLAENVEDARSHSGLGAVVESQGQIEHANIPVRWRRCVDAMNS